MSTSSLSLTEAVRFVAASARAASAVAIVSADSSTVEVCSNNRFRVGIAMDQVVAESSFGDVRIVKEVVEALDKSATVIESIDGDSATEVKTSAVDLTTTIWLSSLAAK